MLGFSGDFNAHGFKNTAIVVISTRVQPLFLAPKNYALTALCKILIGILRGALCLLNWHHVPAAAASG